MGLSIFNRNKKELCSILTWEYWVFTRTFAISLIKRLGEILETIYILLEYSSLKLVF